MARDVKTIAEILNQPKVWESVLDEMQGKDWLALPHLT